MTDRPDLLWYGRGSEMRGLLATSGRDARWLTLEVCREFQRGTCSREDDECRYAHPPKHCQVDNGRVVACFDSLKGRCTRENCKYLHPPPHLKTQLEINGRNNLIQQKNAMALSQLQGSTVISPTQYQPMMLQISPYHPSWASQFSHPLGAIPAADLAMPSTVLFAGSSGTGGLTPTTTLSTSTPAVLKTSRSDRIEVCREFLRGACSRGDGECRYAHPPDSVPVEPGDNTVTVCMDHVKGRCSRDRCKYLHPPGQLLARIRGSPGPPNIIGSTGLPAVQSLKRPLDASYELGLPLGFFPPLAKRQALDKANEAAAAAAAAASALYSPTLIPYHPALSGMHFQHQAAFFPQGSLYSMAPMPGLARVEVRLGDGMLGYDGKSKGVPTMYMDLSTNPLPEALTLPPLDLLQPAS
uniref:muscleblind-like protein 2a isoform X2 n=1 Tax=Myxine glutinosa TaxID=7769 RepID=UPI00358E7E87